MIKRINVLERIGRFTSLNQTTGTQGDFSNLNVIYANNGCGKSTLCDVFRSLHTGNSAYILGRKRLGELGPPRIVISLEDNQTIRFMDDTWHNQHYCPPIHVYDERFVVENVFIGHHVNVDQRRNLYGLVIGAHALDLKRAVDIAEERLSSATTIFNTIRDNLIRLIPNGYTIDTFRVLSPVDDIDNQIESATSELRSAQQSTALANAIRERRPLALLPIAEIPENLEQALTFDLDSTYHIAESTISDHLAATSIGLSISWIKQGFEAQTGTACPHCGQNMDNLEILKAYHSFFSAEFQRHEDIREILLTNSHSEFGESAQNRLEQLLNHHETEHIWWRDAIGFDLRLPQLRNHQSIVNALREAYQAMTSALTRKQKTPSRAVRFTTEEGTAISLWQEIASEIRSYNQHIPEINARINQRKSEAESVDLVPLQTRIAYLAAIKKRHEASVIEAYSEYDIAATEKATAQQNKQSANEALRGESNRLFDMYGTKINELLDRFAVDFRIVNDGVNFRGGRPSGQLAIEIQGARVSSTPESASDPSQTSLANTLSGGDRSALALAYFLARVELDTNASISIVIFDDPYHNQDRSRRQVTIERIHHLTGLSKQCFVFSHDLEFARAVEKRPLTNTKTFILKPLVDPATLESQPLPLLPSQAYENNYHRLHDFSEYPGNHLLHLKEIADTIRVILEEYLRLKFPKSWAENDWLGDMIRKIREAQSGSPLFYCQSLVDELSNINSYSQRFHHGASGEIADEPDPRELKTYVDRTLRVIHTGGST